MVLDTRLKNWETRKHSRRLNRRQGRPYRAPVG